MKQFLIIGMSPFGKLLCEKFSRARCEILATDIDPVKLEEVLPLVTEAKSGDCTHESVLKALGVKHYDACFVCVDGDFLAALQITSLLKELGAKRVIAKATDATQAKFLLRNGADQIIYPENEVAERLVIRENSDKIMDVIEVGDDVNIYEITPMRSWIGMSLKVLNFRARYNLMVFAVRHADGSVALPNADYEFLEDDHVLVVGSFADVKKVTK